MRYIIAVGLLAALGSARAEDPLRLDAGQYGVSRLMYSPDGLRVAGVSYTGETFVWDTHTGKRLTHFKLGDAGYGVGGATFLHDGQTLAVVTTTANARGGTIRLHDLRTGRETARWPVKEMVTALAESPDGTRLAVSTTSRVRLLDTATGDERSDIRPPDGASIAAGGSGVGWTPDSKRVLFPVFNRGAKNELLVCEADGGQIAYRLPASPGFTTRTFAVTPDGAEVIAFGPPDVATGLSKLTAWDLTTGKQTRVIGDRGFSTDFAITPDGKRFVTGDQSAGELLVGDLATGKVLTRWKGWYVNGVDIAPDGNSFVAAGTDMSNPTMPAQRVVRVRIDHLKK